MNKTHNVNIGGIPFIIDDNAYNKLQSYLDHLSCHFDDEEGKEIVEDIEARIGELLNERLQEKNIQVVNLEMIEKVMSIMGNPQDFEEETEDSYQKETKAKSSSSKKSNKQLYRDPDNSIIGGVCSGFAAYIGMDILWVRLITFLVVFLGFGTGILVYILLWIIVPEAKTTSEKLHMRGEKVDISSIERKIKEEADKFGSKINEESSKIKDKFNNKGQYYRDKTQHISNNIQSLASNLFRAFLKVVGFGFMMAGIVFLVLLTSVFLNFSDGIDGSFIDYNWAFGNHIQMFMSIFEDSYAQGLFILGLALLIVVPIVSILFTGIKLLFSINGSFKIFGISMTALFITGILLLTTTGISIGKNMSSEATSEDHLGLKATPIIHLDIENDLFKQQCDGPFDDEIIFTDSLLQRSDCRLYIHKSPIDSNYLVSSKSSNGKTIREAEYFANRINYKIDLLDSVLNIEPQYSIPRSDPFRAQELDFHLYIKEGQKIELSDKMGRIMYDIPNTMDIHDSKMWGETFVMTDNGLHLVE